MKSITVKVGEGQVLVIAAFFVEGKWIKRTLRANDAEELWNGLAALASIESLPAEDQAQAISEISKSSEREFLELAIPLWLQKGNVIKVLKPVSGKAKLSADEREAILNALGELELEVPLPGTAGLAQSDVPTENFIAGNL